MTSMHDRLLTLPLFHGVTRARMSEIVGASKLHFSKFAPGDTIIAAGASHQTLTFVLQGSVRLVTSAANGSFRISQTISSPDVLMPTFLFGRATYAPYDIIALTPVNIMQVSKTEYLNILSSDPIFMLNYLNYLSVTAQDATEGILTMAGGGLDKRVAMWITTLTQPLAKDISISADRDLYTYFTSHRASFLSALETLRDGGLIEFSDKELHVTDRRGLVAMLRHDNPTTTQ